MASINFFNKMRGGGGDPLETRVKRNYLEFEF